jgi:hypothetical protein
MLTKSDKVWLQQNFAIKDDLKNFAIKDDLKNFATKDDLKNFATKDDLKNFATKDDLKPINQKIDKLEFSLKSIKKDTTKIRSDLEMVTGEFDKEQVILKKRVDRIEEHLKFSVI